MTESSSLPFTGFVWTIFDNWDPVLASGDASGGGHVPPPDAWACFDPLVEVHARIVRVAYAELAALLSHWDLALAPLGGDPTHHDWRRFRPLRLSREEDWSDWLAFLLERSMTGVFAASLLAPDEAEPARFAMPRVDREISHDGHRADLICVWRGGGHVHIEVKTGDADLFKTFGTGKRMRILYGQAKANWRNAILLLSHQQKDWAALESDDPEEPAVEVLTWDGVCVALRRALLADESQTWKAWAWAFVGAAEQSLIGFKGHRLSDRLPDGLESKLQVLKEALRHG